MKRLAVAFSGSSNSGKTTLIEKISSSLTKSGYSVVTIKHDPKDKANFDTPNKDSFKFYQSGANSVIMGEKKCAIFFQEPLSFDEIVAKFKDFDYLLLEGLRSERLPRIVVTKNKDEEVIADLIIRNLDDNFSKDQVVAVIDWINKFGKKL